MSNVKFVLNSAGVRELLKSAEMQSILAGYANEVADRAGEGYEARYHVGKKRAYANVGAITPEAKRDNMDNNTLLKSLK